MNRVITYGTFDLLHDGHLRLLARARELGDHLTVGVTSASYDQERGKLNVHQGLGTRIDNVRRTGLADEIIVEEDSGQKVRDIINRKIDIFAVGSDWRGNFDHLSQWCSVVYLERTEGISSTELRAHSGVLRLGMLGTGRIASRMVREASTVNGVRLVGAYSPTDAHRRAFAEAHCVDAALTSVQAVLDASDAVYVASPHEFHEEHVEAALRAGLHVLCEKPLALTRGAAERLYALAREQKVVLLEAIKTAFSPGFELLASVAHSGIIGTVRGVDATFTKLDHGRREMNPVTGGSITELASYVLLPAIKLFGVNDWRLTANGVRNGVEDIDIFSHLTIVYPRGISVGRVGLGVKSHGVLTISGTRGYLHVPAPWWKTEYFEAHFEDPSKMQRFVRPFAGDGLRYELSRFAGMIEQGRTVSESWTPSDSIAAAAMLETARCNTVWIDELAIPGVPSPRRVESASSFQM